MIVFDVESVYSLSLLGASVGLFLGLFAFGCRSLISVFNSVSRG